MHTHEHEPDTVDPGFDADLGAGADVDDNLDGNLDGNDEIEVLPWYRNPWNMVALLLAVLVLAGTSGFVLGERNAVPDPTTSDIGFLQDMRAHHEQAVEMSLDYIAKTGTDPNVEIIANEIAFGQSIEIGRMIQLLREYGKPEANESGTAMAWMNEPVPLDRMPGLATESDLQALRMATGADADQLYLKLMINHHEGGIHMAEAAAATSGTDEVRAFAESMVTGQRSEIVDMQRFVTT